MSTLSRRLRKLESKAPPLNAPDQAVVDGFHLRKIGDSMEITRDGIPVRDLAALPTKVLLAILGMELGWPPEEWPNSFDDYDPSRPWTVGRRAPTAEQEAQIERLAAGSAL